MRVEPELLADRLANAVESLHDAFALFDSADRLIHCNTAYRRLVGGWLSGAIIGKSYEELLAAWMSDMDLASEAERAFFRAHRRPPPTAREREPPRGRVGEMKASNASQTRAGSADASARWQRWVPRRSV
jgi:PAS domain-containing protein